LIGEEGLLSVKPLIYVVNISEENRESPSSHLQQFREFAREEKLKVVEICAQLEMELAELALEEEQKFREEMEIGERESDKLINQVFEELDLITFFTVTGGEEIRAWAIKRGTPAVEAAGKVHSDMKRGFIRAEVIPVDDLLKVRDLKKARSEGKIRLEGKEYRVRDGDVIHFRFSV